MPLSRLHSLICLVVFFALSASAQVTGGLTGRIVYTSAGHGWTYHNSSDAWYTQRGDNNELVEDYGNLDQMNMFVAYCFNAGATVVPFRPVGFQTNEVVLDNTSPGVGFSPGWIDSAATTGFYGAPGQIAYRFTAVAATETATSTYTPTFPATGFYPVYTWAAHGTNRTSQLYRIRHTGGESQLRVPHNMVGSGWVYLGTYYFNAGSNSAVGAVIISNLRATPSSGGVVIADAVRFGNGMGDVIPVSAGTGTPTISGYAREEECARYWIQRAIGVGGPTNVYERSGDDNSDNVGAPPRMAAHMNSEDVGTLYKRIFISFHSNAGGGRGAIGLHNGNHPGTSTPNQLRLAQLVGTEVNNDLVSLTSPPFEFEWHDRGTAVTYSQTFPFGEINDDVINGEFDATIIEVGFHDSPEDAALLRDPKIRNVAARATYQAVIRYMNEFDGLPLVFLPEPPVNVRATASQRTNIVIQWAAPPAGGGSASGYVVHVSTNGYGFGFLGGVAGGSTTSLTFSNAAADQNWYFKVTSTNSAGESLASEIVGCRLSAEARRILFVNAFDRFDRSLNVRQTAGPGIAGPAGGTQTFDRIKPRLMNSFDYVVQHGEALGKAGVAFDSCQNEAVATAQIRLTNYAALIWAAGQESTADESFSSLEQTRIAEYLNGGGKLFVSGAEIAWDLDRDNGPTVMDRSFLNDYLHADLGGNTNDDSGTYNFAAAAGSTFAGNGSARFDDGSFGIYEVQFPDRLTPVGATAQAALLYSGGRGTAAIQNADEVNGSKLVYFGFPFETITTSAARERYMFDVLKFFEVLPRPEIISTVANLAGGTVTLTWMAIPGQRYRIQHRLDLSQGGWFDLAGDVIATNSVATKTDATIGGQAQRFYRAMVVDP